MILRSLTALFLVVASSAGAAGWHDYTLEIAPGYAVARMNSLYVCLEGPEGFLIICPESESPSFGPLVEFAVTPDSIFTRHTGAMPLESNAQLWRPDVGRELFFKVRRADQAVLGPLTRKQWRETVGIPISSVEWVEARNPSVLIPLLGTLLFLGLTLVTFGWPVLALILVVGLVMWLRRRF